MVQDNEQNQHRIVSYKRSQKDIIMNEKKMTTTELQETDLSLWAASLKATPIWFLVILIMVLLFYCFCNLLVSLLQNNLLDF